MKLEPLYIITSTYNDLNGLKTTEHYLSRMKEGLFKWIVIDGLSTDGSVDFLASSLVVSKWISEKDSGIYSAWNKGLNFIGDHGWVIFIGAGDYPSEDWLKYLACNRCSEQLLYSDLVLISPKEVFTRLYSLPFCKARKALPVRMTIPHVGAAISAAIFFDRRFDESQKIISDWTFLADIENLDGRYVPGYIQAYFKEGGVSSSILYRKKHYQEIFNYLRGKRRVTSIVFYLKYFYNVFLR